MSRHQPVSKTHARITDVAARAGVAPMTVSRFINAPELVAKPTAERVRAAIEELGYVPNMIAGGLSSRRSRIIAAIVPTIGTPIFSAAIQSFTDAMGAAGYHVLLGLSGVDGRAEESLVTAILGRRPDGLLITGTRHVPGTRRRLQNAGIPIVEMWDVTRRPIDMLVGFDHAEVGRVVADFFWQKGHRDFAVIAANDPRSQERRNGFVAEVERLGGTLVAERDFPPSTTTSDGRRGLREMVPAFRGPTALLCSSDLVACGAVFEAAAQGLRVPEQVAICGFGDLDIAAAVDPPVTTVSVDGTAIGQTAAACLLQRLAGKEPARRIEVPFRIIARGSS